MAGKRDTAECLKVQCARCAVCCAHDIIPVCSVNVCSCSQQQLHHFQAATTSRPVQGCVSTAPEVENVTAKKNSDVILLQQLCACQVRQEKAASQQFITSSHQPTSWTQLERANSHACTWATSPSFAATWRHFSNAPAPLKHSAIAVCLASSASLKGVLCLSHTAFTSTPLATRN
jgi:hypothetical protein